jgi:predicted permease
MRALREWLLRLAGTLHARRADDDLAEELQSHAALAAERGHSLGGQAQAMDALRDQRGLPWLDDFQRDMRHSVRELRRRPAWTAVTLTILAIGIGANAAVFTVMDAALFKRLPVRDPDSLVLLGDARARGVGTGGLGNSFVLYSYDLYRHLRDTKALDDLLAVESSGGRAAVRREGWTAAQPTRTKLVSGNYFQSLGVNARMGRTIFPADDTASATPVAVVSFTYWTNTLNADPSVVGDPIDINGVPVVIAGVAPPEFHGETIAPDPPAIWLPIAASRAIDRSASVVDSPDQHWLYLIGRVRPGGSGREAETRLTLALRNWLREQRPTTSTKRQQAIANTRVELTPARSGVPRLRRTYNDTLRMLLGISAAVLLLVCANIAGLLLARESVRQSERSLRRALGATRGRLVRQSIAESLTLAIAGGAVALVLGAAAARALVLLAFADATEIPIPTAPDARVLVFTFAVSCGAALLFGVFPAIRVRTGIISAMKETRFRMGKALVSGQVALSLVMLTAAVTLGYSLVNLTRQPFGFDPSRVLVVSVEPRLARYDYSQLEPLYRQIESRVNALPGVTSVALSFYSPFNGCCWAFSVTVPGHAPRDDGDSVMLNRVSPRYFETIGTRVLQGRPLMERDAPASRRVAVVNDAFVRRYFAGGRPLGRTFRIDNMPDIDIEIVGVVEDAKYDEPGDAISPMAFLPLLQVPAGVPANSSESNFINAIEVRTDGDPAAIAPAVRRTLAEIDQSLPVLDMTTIADQIGRALGRERSSAVLAAAFGVIAVVLSCVGVYGVMAYLVQRRSKDIGVRLALGAARGTVLTSMMREVFAQAAAGLVIGIPAVFWAWRLLQHQLFGVTGLGPGTLAAVIGMLAACLGFAGYLPARRASRLDPVAALRSE